jgi:hypothetical protein
MRAESLRRLAGEAGFTCVEVLPVASDFFGLYRLDP